MRFDPFPKYSYITKTICSIFKNLGKSFDYAKVKEIAYDLRAPLTDDEKLVSFLTTFLMVSMVNKNQSCLTVFDYFKVLDSTEGKELKIELARQEKISRDELYYASFLLIEAFKHRKCESLFGALFIMSQNAIFRHCGKFFSYPPCFFSDWKSLFENEQEEYLKTIIQTKIDCLENDGFSIPVTQFDSLELKRLLKNLTPRLIESNVNEIKIFGSYAGDLYTSQSDIDLLVGLEKSDERTDRERITGFIQEEILMVTKKTCDIIFEDLIPPWANNEIAKGVILWEKENALS